MFPSSGLFARFSCPLSPPGACERPHCFYKHAAAAAVQSAGVQYGRLNAAHDAPVTMQTKGDSFQELERINKEIEAVRHEVEQERRRLSCYQTVQPNAANQESAPKYAPEGKPAGGGVLRHTSCAGLSQTQARERKYVVDNSKPRTDLEYDPLSNFSADLLCCNSKEPKVRHQAASAPPSAPPTRVAPRCDSPDPQDDDDDDCVLIIDVPQSPDKATDPHFAVDGPFRDSAQPSKPELPPLPPPDDVDDIDRDVGKSRRPSALNDDGINPAAEGNVVDLTGCLEALQSECDKIIALQSSGAARGTQQDPTGLSEPLEQQDYDPSEDRPKWRSSPGKESPSESSLCVETSAKPQRQHNKPGQSQEKPSKDGVQPLVPGSLKSSGTTPCRVGPAHTSAAQRDAEPGSGSDVSQPQQPFSTSASTTSPLSSDSASEPVGQTSVICISSEEEEEEEESCNHSDIELSDSDPMEECYRIFMEANDEGKASDDRPELSKGGAAEVKPDVAQHAVAGKKRLAHGAAHTEPGAKRRPQPQVLIPFCGPTASGFSSQAALNAKVQQAQQRGTMLNAAARCGQAFGSSVNKKTPVTHSLSSASAPPLQTGPAHNTYSNYLPVGGTVVAMGNNLHLIVPEGAFPLSVPFSSSTVTSVLTPICHPATSTLTAGQVYLPPAVTAGGRSRPAAPVLISALARKPVTSVSAAPPVFPSPAPPANVQVAAKSTPVKRKLKQQQEVAKVPHDVRQRYVNMFTEEFLKTMPNINEAFEKALAEENTVYNRSMNKVKYQSVAVNVLKRLRNQSASASQSKKEVKSQNLRGNVPLDPKNIGGKDDAALYECLKDYVLTDERLIENNYPIRHPEKPGLAVLFNSNKKVNTDPLMRICCRCGATYSVNQSGKPVRKEECTYHYGKGVTKRVPGGVETRYSCCEGVMGAPGCQVFQLHVHDFLSLDGFVSTPPRGSSDTGSPGVFSLDCGMCYAVTGLELSRVTVINSDLQVVYDTFVRPKSEVIDYDTRFSGISEADVKGNHTSIQEVQETLLSFVSADTILIGHSLEKALCLLKLIHGMVVDTSVVFPHRLGPPNKLTLNRLTADYLRRIIQDSVCGHDTAEDAAACMELMLWKVKEDGKLRK